MTIDSKFKFKNFFYHFFDIIKSYGPCYSYYRRSAARQQSMHPLPPAHLSLPIATLGSLLCMCAASQILASDSGANSDVFT